MVRPLAICLEDPAARAEGERYLRCVAVPGRQAGLRVDAAGRVRWRDDTGTACELWVSGDGKLILYRPDGGGRVVVRRAGRELDVPCGRPVVLLDQDRFEVGGRTLRVHVHGPAPAVVEPSFLPPRAPGRGLSRAATALALGAALGAAGCKPGKKPPAEASPEVEVRTQPPDMEPVPEDAAADTATAEEAGETIELRTEPPEIAVRPLPAVDAGTPAVDAAPEPADAAPAAPDAEPAPADADRPRRDAARANPPIEVRTAPPDMPAPDK